MTEQTASSSQDNGPTDFLSYNSPFSYQCTCCGECCRERAIVMTPYDTIRLATHLHISSGQFIQQFLLLDEEGVFLRHRLNGDCIFLEADDCLVYSQRPLACRLYPLQREPSLQSDIFTLLALPPASSGIPGKRGSVREYLKEQKAKDWLAAAALYTELFTKLYEKLLLERDTPSDGTPEASPAPAALLENVTQFMTIIFDVDLMIGIDQQQPCAIMDTDKKIRAHAQALIHWMEATVDTAALLKASQQTQIEKTVSYKGLEKNINHITWPPISHCIDKQTFEYSGKRAVPDGRGATILSLLGQMDIIQWWPTNQIQQQQLLQIRQLVTHFKNSSPFYRTLLQKAGVKDIEHLSFSDFQQLPIITRKDFQHAGETLFSESPPAEHGPVISITTSGSTGTPVTIRCTPLTDAVHWAAFIRNDIWHKRDFGKKFAYIQSYRDLDFGRYPEGAFLERWNEALATGPLVILNVSTATMEEQLEWLQREQPAYLMSFPSNLAGLARLCINKGEKLPWLENISTIGEQLSPAQRQTMEEAWGVPVCETYGCTEATYIAFQHPDREQLMVQSECVYAEIVDEAGRPCDIGQVGRVVITTLHNFATPVIRYEVGDLAVWGEEDKERGLPVIAKVLGRSRDVICLPNGEKGFPLRWGEDIGRLAPVRQWQLIQKSYTDMELRLAVERELSREEEQAIIKAYERVIGSEYCFSVRYVTEIPRAASGKFLEFRCDIPD